MSWKLPGVGTIIHRWLQQRGIRPGKRCGCKSMIKKMDKYGPAWCRENVDDLVGEMQASARQWRKEQREDGVVRLAAFISPPKAVFRKLILAACDEAEVERCEPLSEDEIRAMEREARNSEFTACVTYYERPDALKRLMQSIPSGINVSIQDTNGNLSWGRNQLLQKCKTKYALIMEEDMIWRGDTDPTKLIDILEADDSVAFAGGAVRDQRTPWQHNLLYHNKPDYHVPHLYAYPSEEPWRFANGTSYLPCDLICNFGVLNTEWGRQHPWDERMEVGEHEEWFISMQKAGKRAAYVPSVPINHIQDRPSELYRLQRHRARSFWKVAEKKHEVHIVKPRVLYRNPLNIVVLSVGHTNTTIVTKMLSLLGWRLGRYDKEYYEHIRVRDLNRRMMFEGATADEAPEILSELGQPWVIKDPKFRVTLQNWMIAFAPYEPILLYLTKDHADVLASLERRGESHKLDYWEENCQGYYEAWPWPKMKVDANQIAEAVSQFDLTRTPVKPI